MNILKQLSQFVPPKKVLFLKKNLCWHMIAFQHKVWGFNVQCWNKVKSHMTAIYINLKCKQTCSWENGTEQSLLQQAGMTLIVPSPVTRRANLNHLIVLHTCWAKRAELLIRGIDYMLKSAYVCVSDSLPPTPHPPPYNSISLRRPSSQELQPLVEWPHPRQAWVTSWFQRQWVHALSANTHTWNTN